MDDKQAVARAPGRRERAPHLAGRVGRCVGYGPQPGLRVRGTKVIGLRDRARRGRRVLHVSESESLGRPVAARRTGVGAAGPRKGQRVLVQSASCALQVLGVPTLRGR